MKILFANLGYCRGHDGSAVGYLIGAHRFFHVSKNVQRRILDTLVAEVSTEQPNVLLTAEVSIGSFKNQYFDQHKYLVEALPSVSDQAVSKYGESFLNAAPFHAGNANGVISMVPAEISELYLEKSRKKLVYRVVCESVTIFSVHLPLVTSHRKQQLLELSEIVNQTKGDVVVCGDFNIFDGVDELKTLQDATDLSVVDPLQNTFPAHRPKHPLDVALYRFSNEQKPKIRTLDFAKSDHLPVLIEW